VQDYANRQQLIATRRNENQQAGERINVLSADRQQFQTQESALLRKSEQLARESAEATSESAEIAQAILKLRTHSKDGVCPLCGHPHESEAALQNEIDAKLTAISSVATRLQREARDIEEQRNSVHRKLAAIDDEAARLRHQREEGDRQIESLLQANQALEEQALRANTSLDRGVLESALVSHRSAASAAQTELNETQAKAKITEQSLSEIRAGLGALNERISTDRFTLDQLLLQRAEIDRQIAVSELPTSGLDLIIAQTQGQLVAKRGEYDAKIEAIAALQRDLLAERERVLEIGRNLSAAERTLLELTQAISDMTGRLRSLKLPENTTGEQLSELQEAAIANERETLAFRDLLERFVTQRKRTILEIERDNLRRQHGDLTDAQRRLQDARSQIEVAVAESGKWEAKLAILVKDSVSQRLNQHRIESFRLFQSMIPTPYLFDDITVTQGDGGVRLGLRYRGVAEDVGEPRYFLSSAQANVLALSYFLSFSCRQRWCKLQTILMDDPVQHLDDLDAVALLDVVRALVVSGSKPRRQIIISTCDYNLYALMIRKFSGLPPEQLRFAAISLHDIGTGGPVIRYDYAGTASSRAA
jgi:DNA repair exonuclease SbcCD ATPase subunit